MATVFASVLGGERPSAARKPLTDRFQARLRTSTIPLATRLRLAVVVGCIVLAVTQNAPFVAVGALLVGAGEAVRARRWLAATYAQSVVAPVTVLATTLTAGHIGPAWPLLLVPAFRAGDRGRRRDVLTAVAVSAAALASGWLVLTALVAPMAGLAPGALQWLTLAATVGLLQAASLQRDEVSLDVAAAREAATLAAQLADLVRRLPHGLHAPAVAEAVLDVALEAAPADRAALLVRQDQDVASPLAVRGAARVPWRDPVRCDGTPARAWRGRSTCAEVRQPDDDGRRHGSAMLCVPLLDAQGDLVGLLVLERSAARAFEAAEVAAIEAVARRFSPQVQAALLFGDLQMVATIAERERLAREMHDGIAQDLVALAFSLDLLARTLRQSNPEAAQPVVQVRDEVTRLVRDIRFSIADLRSSVRPERGLGAALSSQVQSMATATRLTMHLSLRESTFRLPAQLETAYLRAAQAVLHDVRSDQSATEVWVSLDVEPPGAELVVRHDARGAGPLDGELVEQLGRLGVRVTERPGELRVTTGTAGATIPRQAAGADR